MKNLAVVMIVPFLFACTKEEISFPSSSLEGGVWKAACYSSGSSYDIMKVSFSGGQFIQSQSLYADSYCGTPAAKIDISATYVLGGARSDVLGSYGTIDAKLVNVTLTLQHAQVVTQYNSNAYCGFTDWVINVPKSIVGRTCDGTLMGSVGEMSYDIYMISSVTLAGTNTYEGQMRLGYNDSTYDGTTPAKRPTAYHGGRGFFNYSQ